MFQRRSLRAPARPCDMPPARSTPGEFRPTGYTHSSVNAFWRERPSGVLNLWTLADSSTTPARLPAGKRSLELDFQIGTSAKLWHPAKSADLGMECWPCREPPRTSSLRCSVMGCSHAPREQPTAGCGCCTSRKKSTCYAGTADHRMQWCIVSHWLHMEQRSPLQASPTYSSTACGAFQRLKRR